MADLKQSALTGVIIGAGHRSIIYAAHALRQPDEFRVVGLAEPDPVRRRATAEQFGIPAERCFASSEELAAQPQFADLAINGTMDKLHVPTTLPLLDAGYDVLLEKPIAPTRAELLCLLAKVRATGRKLSIGHVLRYAPYYVMIRERLAAGEIGQVLSVNSAEMVSYHHMALGWVRGKWNKQADQSSFLLAKCCHDTDALAWLKSGVAPRRVASFGSLTYFRPEHAPQGAGTRCLVDCPIERDCDYSARKHYLEQNLWGTYVWHCLEHLGTPTEEQKEASLRTDNPHGRCVWRCDNDVVDHQSVLVEFADGCVATHDLVGGMARPCRRIHVRGTHGEIEGVMEDGYFVVRHADARAGHEYREEQVAVDAGAAGHGGGDERLFADFLNVVAGRPASLSSTNILDSVYGHLIVYAADEAMATGQVVEIGDVS